MDLVTGSVSKKLIQFSMPIIVVNVLAMAYTMIDSIIVSRFVGETGLSILSTSMSCILVGQCFIMGAAMCINILVGRWFGAKEYNKLGSGVVNIIGVNILFSLILSIIHILFVGNIVEVLKVPAQIQRSSMEIIVIYVLSFVPQSMVQIFSGILYGLGDSKNPTKYTVISQILNIIFDMIFILVFNLGVHGAAMASTLCIIINMIILAKITYIKIKPYMHTICLEMNIIKDYLKIALPSLLQQASMSFGNLLLQVIVNGMGVDFINGYVVACQVQNLMIIPIISCCNGYETFASINIGAKENKRVHSGFSWLIKAGILCSILLGVITLVFGKGIIHMYLDDGIAFDTALFYTWILIPNSFFLLTKYGMDSIFKANMKVILFTISSFISLISRVIFSYILVVYFGIYALAIATVLGNFIATIFNGSIYFKSYYHKDYSSIN